MDFIDIGLYAGYLLVVVCALAAVLIPLIYSLDNPRSLIKSGIGVAGVLVIFLISYAIADDTAVADATASTSRWVGAGLITTYIAFFGAIVGIVYTEISKMLG